MAGGGVRLERQFEDDGQRDGQQHADRAQQPAPEHQRQEHDQHRQAEAPAHEARLEELPDGRVDDDVAEDDGHDHGRAELQPGQQDGRHGGEDGADVGDVVEQEGDQAPEDGVVDAQRRQPRGDQYAGEEAGQRFGGQIAVDAVGEARQRRVGVGQPEGAAQFLRQVEGFQQDEDDRHQDQQRVRQQRAEAAKDFGDQGQEERRVEVGGQLRAEFGPAALRQPFAEGGAVLAQLRVIDRQRFAEAGDGGADQGGDGGAQREAGRR